MVNSSQPVIKITDLEQVCMVVHDIEKSMRAMWETFGIGPWDIYVCNADFVREKTYYGKPAQFGYKVARTHDKLGSIEIELIQPLEGDNIYSDFLKEHGEGIQHLAWLKVDSLEAFNETKQKLEAAGFPCIMSGNSFRAFAYFDTTKVLNTLLEMIHWDPSVTSKPDGVFPE